jgi:hypothetical protein
MIKKHRTETDRFVGVLWQCVKCDSHYSEMYSEGEGRRRERRQRWH